VEDVIFHSHFYMTRMAAVGYARRIGAECVRWRVIVKKRVAPPATLRKPIAIFLDQEGLLELVGHIHHEGRFSAFLERPLQFGDLGALRKGLAVSRESANLIPLGDTSEYLSLEGTLLVALS
jgi:hypothetical protein